MKVTTRLKFFGVFIAGLILVLAGIVYWRFLQVNMALVRSSVAGDMVKDAFILTTLNDDYIRNHGERARIQWKIQHGRLDHDIATYAVTTPQEQHIIDRLRRGQQTVLTHFVELQTLVHLEENAAANPATTSMLHTVENRLNGQLSIDMQTIVSLATNLADSNSQLLAQIRQSTLFSILLLIFFLGVSLFVSYLFLAQGISRAVKTLITGTKALAGGDFAFRFANTDQDEFGQVAESFNMMASQLQQLENAKDEFITLASHELRTPVTAVKGFIYMLLKGGYGPINDEVKKTLERISASTDRQVRLINDLLDVSRIQTGTIRLTQEDFSLGPVVQEVVESLQPIARQKEITINAATDYGIIVHADPDWVKQILNNLLGNALKFTSKGSVAVSYALGVDTTCDIIITDTGMGISKENQKKLFGKFQQLSSSETGKPDGSGLGLYISRYIAREMGGDIWIEKSEPGKGSVFIFSIRKAVPS